VHDNNFLDVLFVGSEDEIAESEKKLLKLAKKTRR